MVDNIVKVEKDVNSIKEKYETEIRNLSITEKPSEEANEKLDELAKKSEFLEGVGVKLKPEDYVNLGLDLFYKEEYEKAEKAFGKATELKPDNTNAQFNKACAYSLKGEKEQSFENLRKAIALDSKYKKISKKDEDFKNLWDDEDFKKIVE